MNLRFRWVIALVVLGLVCGFAIFLAIVADAQGPLVPTRNDVIEQRLRDLLDYRNYLEDQLAAAKTVITQQDAQFKACQAKQAEPPKAP